VRGEGIGRFDDNVEYTARVIREHYAECAECAREARSRHRSELSVLEPPSRDDIMLLRAWLRTAELPDPPMVTMPGVEAWSPELARMQLLAETDSPSGPARAFLESRYIAVRYGPPEIRELARPDQLPGDPRGPQL
jgi:hypothetical protein